MNCFGKREHQVAQAEQRHQVRDVLGQPAIPGLAMHQEVLEDVKRMLDLRPGAGFGLFHGLERLTLVGVGERLAQGRASSLHAS